MPKQGVSKISGNSAPKIGEKTTYTITDWYSGTPKEKRNPALVTWELFKKRSNGRFTTTNIKKTGDGTFTFGEVAQKHTYRLEAYLYEAEGKGTSIIEITPQPVEIPKINKVELFYVDDTKGSVFSYMEKLVAKAQCVNLQGKKLTFTLWEDDAQGDQHNANNLIIERKEGIVGKNGEASVEFQLTKALMQKAMKGEADSRELEFYVTVEYFKNKKHATNNVDVKNPLAFEIPKEKPQPNSQQQQKTATPSAPPKAEGSPAAQKQQSQKEEKGIIDKALDWWNELWDYQESKGTVKPQQKPTQPAAGGKSTTTVEGVNVEGLIDAYFAKKEYTLKTEEEAGTHTYTFTGSKNQNIDKEKVGKLIQEKVSKAVQKDKKYAKLESVKEALSKDSYNKGESITFKLHKLDAEFKRINGAQLEAKVYLVAKGVKLDGKQATITVKEKDGFIKGAPNAVLPLLEITEQQMEDNSKPKEVQGTEKTQFTATFEKGIAKIPVQLRPKSDEDLKQWKEKLSKGKKEGEYTYTFKNPTSITAQDKKNIAGIILKNAKEGKSGNPKIEQGKTAFVEDIDAALQVKAYNAGDKIKFPTYKKEREFLFLQAQAKGEKQYDKEFLKKDKEYFEITKTKAVIFPLLVKPENDKDHTWGEHYYWAASQGNNQTTFNSNRSKGTRKHAGRDLYTEPKTTVVAMADGVVLKTAPFYAGTDYIAVHHKTNDGREFIINYGEVDPGTKKVKDKDEVTQGQELGVTGYLHDIVVIKNHTIYMLHFEHYSGELGFDMDKNHILSGDNKYKRRGDLVDPLEILQEAYRNTFGEGTGDDELFTEQDGKDAITELYNKYKDKTWKWKWEGSEEEVEVTGKQLVTIVEKMYRLETSHFKSKQYQNCGTGGMEAFGDAPYYGWDSTLFIEEPVGTWSAFEGKGLSGAGGNAQVTDKKKEFVKLPSVLAGMEYKAKYIIKYNGNYARWFNSSDTTAQTSYRDSLKGIKARYIDEIAE